MQIKEFRQKVKDLAEKHGIKRKKVTIIFTEGARIIITCNNLEIFKNLKSKILQLAKLDRVFSLPEMSKLSFYYTSSW